MLRGRYEEAGKKLEAAAAFAVDQRCEAQVQGKLGEVALTMEEVEQVAGAYSPRMLFNGQVFKF